MPKQVRKRMFEAELELAGLSQADLCRLLGVTSTTVNRWLRARHDGLAVPRYALFAVRAWNLLPANARKLMLNDAARNR